MSELLTVTDLEIAKKHDTFHSEVITGKAGGVAGGASIDSATNAVTGQVQKTLPNVMKEIAGNNLGDWPGAGDPAVTLTSVAQTLRWQVADGGDGHDYAWTGAFPKVVSVGSTPTPLGSGGWVDRSDVTLRGELAHGCIRERNDMLSLRDIVSVADFGALGGVNDDTSAFQNALTAGGGSAFVPYIDDGYTVNSHVYGLVGFGHVKFNGSGLVSYTDLSKPSSEYLTCANIAKRLSDGEDLTIACFGDSTMYGYLVGGATSDVQDPNNMPASLKRTLGHIYGYTGTVINAGVSGSNMNGLMKGAVSYESKISSGGIAYDAVVIYCNMGINNCQSNLSIDEFKQNYSDFVSITRRHGKVPVIVTPNPINPLFGGDARESTQIEMYVNAMRSVAAETGCDLVDNYYWTKQTAKRYTETILVPDGIHPSSDLYKQLGRNLAIPLVSAHTLKQTGDIASIAGSSYLDSSGVQILRQNQTRTGLSYASKRDPTQTGINVAVVLNEPFEWISFMALHWENGAIAQVGVQDNTSPWGFIRCGKDTGAISHYKWDTDFVVKTDAMAGLNILYWLYDITDTRPTFDALALSGFSVPDSSARSFISNGEFNAKFSLTNRSKISSIFNFVAGGDKLTFKDSSNVTVFELYLNSSNEMKIDLSNEVSGVISSSLIASGEPGGSKHVTFSIYEDKINVTFKRVTSGVTVSVNVGLSNSITPCVISNIGLMCQISKF